MSEQTIYESQRSSGGMPGHARTGVPTATPRRRRSGPLSGERMGDYQLCELLGKGGMAEVYRAEDPILRREVAVKVLATHLADDSDYADQFRAEARRVGALSHPHLVPVYQAGEAEIQGKHLLYLVMPLLQGSLRDRRQREGKVPAAEAVWLALQVADGLEAAHQSGIVHCDVKPGNVLIDEEGHTLLADFGIARELCDASRSVAPAQSGVIRGTPEYMAPEQLCGEPVDQRADVYSLGAVIYELLTGQLPFVGATPYEVAVHALHAPLIPPSVLEPGVAPALERVVLTALARDPAKRYSGAGVFAQALRNVLSDLRENTQPLSPPRWDGGLSRIAYRPHALQNGTERIRRQRWPWPQVVLAASLMLMLAGSGSLLALMQHGVGTMTSAQVGGMFERSSAMGLVRAPATTPTPGASPTETPNTSLTSLGVSPGHKQGHKSGHKKDHNGDHKPGHHHSEDD